MDADLCMFSSILIFYHIFIWQLIIDEGSIHELRLWSKLFIQSDFKMAYPSE